MFWSETFLYFFVFGLGVLFFLFMVKKLRYFESTKYLFYITLCLYFIVFIHSLRIFKYNFLIPSELNNTSYFIAFLGVFVRLYLMKMIYPVKSFSLKKLKHFILPAFVILTEIFVRNIKINESVILIFQQFAIPKISINHFSIVLFIIGFSYIISSLIIIVRFINKKSEIFKRINNKTLIWLKIVVFVTTCFMILEALLFFKQNYIHDVPLIAGQQFLIIALIFYILLSPSTVKKMRGCVYVIPETNHVNVLPRAFRGTSYDYWHSIIEDYVSIKMPYLNTNFNVNEMASDLSISKQKLLTILKYVYRMDFMEFVNRYRVYYFLELSNDKAFNALHVEYQALRVGFYNKSDFYYYCRKYMNSLPPLTVSQD